MRKVRVLVPIASADWSHTIGDVVEIPAEQAANWISGGLAEAVDEPAAPAPAKKKK
jgi:hypothetical protein